ncbi:MAG: TolB family protein, partial [Bryobacteraceae bacterium]
AALSPDGSTLAIVPPLTAGSLLLASPPSAPPKPYQAAPFPLDHSVARVYIQFSPDSRKLGVTLAGGPATTGEFWVLPMPSGTPRRLNFLSTTVDLQPFSWMPGSRHVVVGARESATGNSHLHVADTESGRVQPLTASGGYETFPSVSPDGSRIVYSSHQDDFDLVELPLAGAPPRPLLSTDRSEHSPAWSPVHPQYIYITDRTGADEIRLRSVQEGWDRPLVTDRDFGGEKAMYFHAPAFSPGGLRIVYGRRAFGRNLTLWVSSLAGGPPVRVAAENANQLSPAWSPDGNWIAYVRVPQYELVRVRPGGTPEIVAKAPFIGPPQWSPDGTRLLCNTTGPSLAVISLDGQVR